MPHLQSGPTLVSRRTKKERHGSFRKQYAVCVTRESRRGGATLAIFFRILKCITLSSMQRPRKLEKNEDPAFVRLLCHQDSLQSDALQKSAKYERSSKKWKELTDSVTLCLAKDMIPIYSVEKEGFREMLRKFEAQYDLPGRKYFSQIAIPALYSSTREKVKSDLQDVEFFAATTDMWSSSTTQPYISYTVHYVDKEWCLQSRCLQTLFMPQDHTADNIAESMAETLDAWGLKAANQVCLTTDNGRNIVCATTRRLNWNHLPCFGHNLGGLVELLVCAAK